MQTIDSIKPVFIFGMPKSGTSLMLSLLDDHDNLVVFPTESKLFKLFHKHRFDFRNKREFVDFIFTKTGFATFNPYVDRYKYESNLTKKVYLDAINYDDFKKELLNELDKNNIDFNNIKSIFLVLTLALAKIQDKKIANLKYFIEKTPFNEFYLNEIKDNFSDYKIIHIIRDPRDNFAAYKIFTQQKYGYFNYEFIELWLKSYFIAKRNQNKKNYFLVSYEALVRKKERVIKDISDFLGIPFNESMLTPTLAGKLWPGNSSDKIKFNKISNSRVGIYKNKLNKNEIIIIDYLCLNKKISLYSFLKALRSFSNKEKARIILIFLYKWVNFVLFKFF